MDSYLPIIAVYTRLYFFFFSSRRRHTRCGRDWSSDVCSSDLGTSADLGRLSVLALTVGLRRPLRGGFTVGAAVGGLKYLPAGETGIFRSGAGGVFALAGAVASYTPPRAVGRCRLGGEARYDVHRFITPALRSEGFTSARTVHRVALALRAARAAS